MQKHTIKSRKILCQDNLFYTNPSNIFNNTALILIGINIGVYLLLSVIPELEIYLSLNVMYMVRYKMFWQPLTYMFVHSGFTHILFNMIGLLFFGIAVERRIGSKEFLLIYLIAGIFAGLFSFIIYYFSGMYFVFLMGASGAVYGILLAYAVIYPRSQLFIWGVLPVPAPLLIVIYAGMEIASQLFGSRYGVAHMTHLAGFAAVWLYFMIRMGINPYKVWKDAYYNR